jgi:hypothetical protein
MSFEDELRKAQAERAVAARSAHFQQAKAEADQQRIAERRGEVGRRAYNTLVAHGAEVFALVSRLDASNKKLPKSALSTAVFFARWNSSDYPSSVYVDDRGEFYELLHTEPLARQAKRFEQYDYFQKYEGGIGFREVNRRMKFHRINGLRVLAVSDAMNTYSVGTYPPVSVNEIEAYVARCVAERLEEL